MNKPKVSIIIINYNTKEITLNCLTTLYKYTKNIDFEVILIDNGSKEKIREAGKYNSLTLIENKKNLGYARGNNIGIKKAKGDYILLLNSDTIIKSNVVGEITKWMDKNKKIGISTCMLKNEDGSIQGTGGYFPNLVRVISWMTVEDLPFVSSIIKPFHPQHSKSPFNSNSFYLKMRNLDWVTGAFMFIRKKVVEEIGVIDEDYFMYTEDTDYCYRAKKAGWEIVYNPKWSIVHLGGKSSTSGYPIVSEFEGIKTFYKKHYPGWQMPILRLFLKIGAFWRIFIFGILYGKEAATTYAKAFIKS